MASSSSSTSLLLSQALFDETVLENEACFDLSPGDALRETIEQFCQQLGVAPPMTPSMPTPLSSTSVLAAASPDGGAATAEDAPATGTTASSVTPPPSATSAPAALSHLLLSHPRGAAGLKDRADRASFQSRLDLLDGCVASDGTVQLNLEHGGDPSEDAVLRALEEVGRRCGSGVGDGYLAIFQRTRSLYTFMSLLSVLDGPEKGEGATFVDMTMAACAGNPAAATRTRILKAVVRTLSSVLSLGARDSTKASGDDEGGALLRADLRDLFVPALPQLVCLIGTAVTTIERNASSEGATAAHREESLLSMQQLCCDLLQLGINATRGCEGAKVAFVQASLPTELQKLTMISAGNNTITKRAGVAVVISCLSIETAWQDDVTDASLAEIRAPLWTDACRLLASLCRYDDFRGPAGNVGSAAPATSSAHDHAMDFHRAGAAAVLIRIARVALSKLQAAESLSRDKEEEVHPKSNVAAAGNDGERLAAAVLTALRALAVKDEIVQTMVALGLLPIVTEALQLCVIASENAVANDAAQRNKQRLAAATLGLIRNLCGNDEIKTNLCLSSSAASVLPHLLQSMRLFPSTSPVQEHACGTIAAMALRRPDNARHILSADGPRWILTAMRCHAQNVNVQRQGALAVRNIASRLLRDLPEGEQGAAKRDATNGGSSDDERTSVRDAFLDLGAEEVLRDIAGRHQASVDEAYAALLCLHCKVSLLKFSPENLQKAGELQPGRTMMFGEKHNSAFRPVYEESQGLSEGIVGSTSLAQAE